MQSRPFWLGPCLVVVAAVSFAAGSTTAVVAYDAGATPLSVITTRITFTLLVVFVLIRVTGGALGLPPRDRAIALAVGLVLGVQSYSHYEAIGLLPVAIAILVLYLSHDRSFPATCHPTRCENSFRLLSTESAADLPAP